MHNLKTGRRTGKIWDDVLLIDKIIGNFPFNQRAKNEREFETGFANVLLSRKNDFNLDLRTQVDKDKTRIETVNCLKKENRPDVTFDNDGIAIELKHFTYDEYTKSIGQCLLYRLRYRFVFLVVIVHSDCKDAYYGVENNSDVSFINLSEELKDLNIYTYLVPSFDVSKRGIRKSVKFFDWQ